MTIMYTACLLRLDAYYTCNFLARLLTKWTPICDVILARLIGYLKYTKTYAIKAVLGDPIEELQLAMYVDAVAWVEVPNTLGMSQFADGGIVGTKPYIASGAYIDRMSNYCKSCQYNPKVAAGDNACPFTSLYWQFIDTNQQLISQNHRLRMQLNNWFRKSEDDRADILSTAQQIRTKFLAD